MKISKRQIAATRFDRLWFDFFDLFGIVWGRRIQDRVNDIANLEQLPARLELDGFVWPQASTKSNLPVARDGEVSLTNQPMSIQQERDRAAVEARIEHILRWLLRRFVDASWIDSRLGSNSRPSIARLPADS